MRIKRRLAAARLADEREHLAAAGRSRSTPSTARDRLRRRGVELHRARSSMLEQRRSVQRSSDAAPRLARCDARRRPTRVGGDEHRRRPCEHSSIARLAARVERAPGRQGGRVGRIAGEAARRHPRAGSPIVGNARGQRRACTGGAGGEHLVRSGPPRRCGPRTSRPAARRSTVSTDRSWVMNTSASPLSRCSSVEQLEHLGLHHHVERGGRLVGDQQLGLAGERSAISTRWRWPPDSWCGYERRAPAGIPTRSSNSSVRRRAVPSSSRRVQLDRLLDLVADAPYRVERVERALEHDRRARPAHRPQAARLHRVHVLAVEDDLARDLVPTSAAGAAPTPAIVDLPHPDSPARPTVSPGSISRSTPRTAGT